MSRSNMYAVMAKDLDRVMEMMNEHADKGLPFVSLEYDEGYEEETQEGISRIPSYDEILACNIDGTNALEPAAWRHLVSTAIQIVGLSWGTGGEGVTIHTRDRREIAVIPHSRHQAYRKMNDVERRAFEAGMTEPIVKPEPEDL
jgi:hypothetical protein